MQYAYNNGARRPGPAEQINPPPPKNNGINIENIDYAISVSAAVLVLFGIIMVFSSSYYVAGIGEGDPLYYFKKQALFAVMGFCAMYLMSNMNYQFIKKAAPFVYLMANVLLVVVQFFPSNSSARAMRWINIPGLNISFQPSEFAKIGVILMLSAVIGSKKDLLNRWGGVFKMSALVLVPCALVAISDFGTAIVLALIGFGIIFIAAPHTIRYLFLGALGGGAAAAYVIFGGGFRSNRFYAWLDPFAYRSTYGNQIVNSLFAVGSGGFLGLGLGQSRLKIGFLPEAHNDMIFSIVCEELGFIGAFLILALFCILIARGIKTAMNALDSFGSLVASGIVLMFGCQAIINVAVVTNSIPNTGITLPFISYGGSSLVISMFMIGVLLNISRLSRGR